MVRVPPQLGPVAAVPSGAWVNPDTRRANCAGARRAFAAHPAVTPSHWQRGPRDVRCHRPRERV